MFIRKGKILAIVFIDEYITRYITMIYLFILFWTGHVYHDTIVIFCFDLDYDMMYI